MLDLDSDLMRSKLEEMDEVIARIHAALIEHDRTCTDCLPSLFVVCSDHGMTDVCLDRVTTSVVLLLLCLAPRVPCCCLPLYAFSD